MINHIPKVLFFDSGIGGLSILQTCQNYLQNQIEYFYCADTSFFPYSEKEPVELSNHIAQTLTKLIDLYSIDIVVLACNTATILTIKNLRTIISTPIIGVEPALKQASIIIKEKGLRLSVGILATKNTIKSDSIQSLAKKYFPENKLFMLGSTDLVTYAENFILGKELNKSLKDILAPWVEDQPDIIILGCTHFPLIKNQIAKLFPNTTLLDPNLGVNNRLADLLSLKSNYKKIIINNMQFISTADTIQDQEILKKYGFTKFTSITN